MQMATILANPLSKRLSFPIGIYSRTCQPVIQMSFMFYVIQTRLHRNLCAVTLTQIGQAASRSLGRRSASRLENRTICTSLWQREQRQALALGISK